MWACRYGYDVCGFCRSGLGCNGQDLQGLGCKTPQSIIVLLFIFVMSFILFISIDGIDGLRFSLRF
jgi:hypothetical protein